LALAIHAEHDRNEGDDPLNGREKVPVPADRGNSHRDGSRRLWCNKVFFGNEIKLIRWDRSFRVTEPSWCITGDTSHLVAAGWAII
jgi:hypothetical protein